MKFKQHKNKKTKVHVRFDAGDRKNYLLGFRKRKLQRKEKAKLEMKQSFRKEKTEVKKRRLELIQNMIEDRSIKYDDDEVNEEETETPQTDSKVTDYGDCTVEVSDIDLQHKSHLGVNNTKLKVKGNSSNATTEGKKIESCSYKIAEGKISSRLVKSSLWKSATRVAKRNYKKEKRENKKKKKVLVTEL